MAVPKRKNSKVKYKYSLLKKFIQKKVQKNINNITIINKLNKLKDSVNLKKLKRYKRKNYW